ncbi:hypothetical protein F8388_018325 [Cannabis sativa]|uniref:SHSP domain-containing protein n=1 Tax=Cannabis sativa TaxID=3483 RepID=A0A7J6HEZ3_CANSA|nr:hypothetical protein F8388_018325 [Cannabis sativa]
MPGMTKEGVKVWVEEKMFVLKAHKEPKKKENGVNNGNGEGDEDEWSAKSYGKYSCRIALPENIQFEKIRAEVKDGVLYINIPKANFTVDNWISQLMLDFFSFENNEKKKRKKDKASVTWVCCSKKL